MQNRGNLTSRQALEIIAGSSQRRFVDHDPGGKDCRDRYENRPDVWCNPCLALHAMERQDEAEREAIRRILGAAEKKIAEAADWQRDVLNFHQAFGLYVGESGPAVPAEGTAALRANLLREEVEEVAKAMQDCDLAGVADGVTDLIYVALGTAVSYGIDIAPVWAAVHKANMAKIGGHRRPDGKWIKPDGWTAPDVAGLLERQRVAAGDGVG